MALIRELVKEYQSGVIPAKAGIQNVHATPQTPHWIPAFAGMTGFLGLVEGTGVLRRHFFTTSQDSDASESATDKHMDTEHHGEPVACRDGLPVVRFRIAATSVAGR